jgi:hypothetical protein
MKFLIPLEELTAVRERYLRKLEAQRAAAPAPAPAASTASRFIYKPRLSLNTTPALTRLPWVQAQPRHHHHPRDRRVCLQMPVALVGTQTNCIAVALGCITQRTLKDIGATGHIVGALSPGVLVIALDLSDSRTEPWMKCTALEPDCDDSTETGIMRTATTGTVTNSAEKASSVVLVTL